MSVERGKSRERSFSPISERESGERKRGGTSIEAESLCLQGEIGREKETKKALCDSGSREV